MKAGSVDILLAVMGMSPGILTETVWVLAHETPPLVPHQVVVMATRPARELLVRVLFEQGGWERVRRALMRKGLRAGRRLHFGPASEHIRLFPSADGAADLDDLTTAADQEAAADFILRTVRGFTEDPSTRVIASIAGGRKSMSALLTSCMTLLGRPQDRLCHVLVSPAYESGELDPPFLFPEEGVIHRLPRLELGYPSVEARIELADIPFVRVRSWYERDFKRTPPSYMALVEQVQGRVAAGAALPTITIDLSCGEVRVDGRAVAVSAAEFALLAVAAERFAAGCPWRDWSEIGTEMEALHQEHLRREVRVPAWRWEFQERAFDRKEDPRKLASSLRKKLIAATPDPTWVGRFLPNLRMRRPGPFPADRIQILR